MQPSEVVPNFAHADIVVNVIDTRQKLAQMVVKAGLSLVSDGRYANSHHHLAHETVLLDGQTMSGRKGTAIAADTIIQGLDPIGIGKLKFSFLKVDPQSQIDYRPNEPQDNQAAFIMYQHARIRGIERKAKDAGINGTPDWNQIGNLELDLAKIIVKYPSVLEVCVRDVTPHPMCAYALELATAFNDYYNHKGTDGRPDTNILNSIAGLREARLAIAVRLADQIKEVLNVLGIDTPDEM